MSVSEEVAGQIYSETIAVIGYGSQGHAHALNLGDTGATVVVGLRHGGESWTRALSDGWQPVTVAEAVEEATTIVLCTPDSRTPTLFAEEIEPNLSAGDNLVFCHGYNIRYGMIVPPKNVDVTMVAPSGPGQSLRSLYTQGYGLPGLIAVHQDATGMAWTRARSYAHAIGCTRATTIDSTFEEETETDLFGEQVVLCGGLMGLIRNGFETLVRAGYQPEVAYLECVHQVKLLAELVQQGGLSYMLHAISDTAEWGAYDVAPRVIGDESRRAMEEVLDRVRSGEFAREWQQETAAGMPIRTLKYHEVRDSQIERVGREIRSTMPFLPPKEAPREP